VPDESDDFPRSLLRESEFEGPDLLTPIGVPEFGAVGLMEFAVVADSIARGAAFELSPLKEPAGAPVRLGVLERSTVDEPVKDPVPVEVFELIRLSAEPETGPFRPVLFVPKIAEPEPPEALELSAGLVETPVPLELLELIRLFTSEPPPPVPALDPPPTACASAALEQRAIATANTTVAGFMTPSLEPHPRADGQQPR
jgi:hypothetical protein